MKTFTQRYTEAFAPKVVWKKMYRVARICERDCIEWDRSKTVSPRWTEADPLAIRVRLLSMFEVTSAKPYEAFARAVKRRVAERKELAQ